MDEKEMNNVERKQIARQAAQETVREMFEQIGIDVSSPEARKHVRETWARLQTIQTISNKAGAALLWVMVGLFATGIVYAFWEGLKHFIKAAGGDNG